MSERGGELADCFLSHEESVMRCIHEYEEGVVIANLWQFRGITDMRRVDRGCTLSPSTNGVMVPALKCKHCGHTISESNKLTNGREITPWG